MKETIARLSAADVDYVKAKERELERGPESKWACTHCPAHLTHSIQYNDVIQHVRETCVLLIYRAYDCTMVLSLSAFFVLRCRHAIENPEEVVDLISFRRMRKDYAIEYEPTS